jgi:hypothetical protein
MMAQCINTTGFMFNMARLKVKYDKVKNCKPCSCNKCRTYKVSNNVCMIKLTQEQFVSSTLEITTSKEEAWQSFKDNITSLIYGHFIISLGKNNKHTFHSIFGQLIKVKRCGYPIYCEVECPANPPKPQKPTNNNNNKVNPSNKTTSLICDGTCPPVCPIRPIRPIRSTSSRDYIILYFKYNFIPNNYCNMQNSYLIRSDVPTIIANNNNVNDPDAPEKPCIDINSYFKLEDGCYSNLKFYYDDQYVYTPSFVKYC